MRSDRFNMVCVANLKRMKGQDIIISKMNDLLSIAPNLEVYFVGKIEPSTGRPMVEMANRSLHRERIHFLGSRKNALDYIYAAQLLVLPSRSEAMPRVILEAMALGTPILATNVDGIPDLIEDGVHGLLFPLDDAEAMDKAFRKIYDSAEIREMLARSAHQKYQAVFSREKQWERFAAMLRDMTKALTGALPSSDMQTAYVHLPSVLPPHNGHQAQDHSML
jgi:glycosyltransferase involved in cell wall biosynthesis